MSKGFVALVLAIVAAWVLNDSTRAAAVTHQSGGILVTGASSGIGRACTLALAAKYTVFAGVRNERDAAALRGIGLANLHPIILDVTNSESVQAARTSITTWLAAANQSLIGLVNNAGVSRELPLEATPLAEYAKMHEVNVVGTLRVTQAFLPLLRASQGRIVNIGSVAGLVAVPLYGAYGATKFALEAMTDVLRRELADFGISVSMVNPGCVATAMQVKMETSVKDLEHEMGPDLWGLYRNVTRSYLRAREESFLSASTSEVTTEAIVDALTSPAPQYRYVVATAGGYPAYVYVFLSWLLPARWMDAILALGAAQF